MASDATTCSTKETSWLYRPVFPESWEPHVLYSLATWINGMAFKNINFSPTGRPVIKIAEIKGGITAQTQLTDSEYDKRYFITQGDMLFSWSGQPETSIDAFYWDGPDGWLNQHVFKVLPNDDSCTPSFLFYILKYLKPNFIGIARNKQTTGLGHVTKADMQAIQVAVPDRPTQDRITYVLGKLDARIAVNLRMNRTLEKMAAAIFKSWFIDFDPVRAKAEGRDVGLPAAIADLFPDSFEESELGPIPKGWKVEPFTNRLNVMGGGTPKTSNPDFWGGDIPWFSVVDTPPSGEVFVVDTEKKVTQAGVDNSSTRILSRGTTIISARGTVGNLALVGIPMAMNQSCYGLNAIHSKDGYFLYFSTRSVVGVLKQRTHGSVFDTITRKTLDGVLVVQPPIPLELKFDNIVKPWLDRILGNVMQSRTLEIMRDTLLPKLLSGEIEVPYTAVVKEVL
jgi:type I restriction enzyme S subunit